MKHASATTLASMSGVLAQYTRLPANTPGERERLVQAISESLAAIQSSARGSK